MLRWWISRAELTDELEVLEIEATAAEWYGAEGLRVSGRNGRAGILMKWSSGESVVSL